MRRKSRREKIRWLEPVNVDSGQWKRQMLAVEFLSADEQRISYQGNSLTALPGPLHLLEFTFTSSALRPAEVCIPLLVSAEAEVRLFMSEQEIEVVSVPPTPAGPAPVCWLKKDITQWSEPEHTSKLSVRIAYAQPDGVTTLLLDQTQPAWCPRLSQRWTNGYTAQSLLFFVLAWGCLLGAGVLLVSHLQFLGDTLRHYAVLAVVGAWAASVMGLPDLAKLPLRAWLRRAYALTRGRRRLLIALLALLMLPIGAGAGVVVYCLHIRWSYTELIRKAMENEGTAGSEENLRRAFVLLPWRKEAQILFERSAWVKRPERQQFKAYVRDFTVHPEVRQAVEQALIRPQRGLALKEESSDTLADPVTWYASLLPEGEREGQLERRQEAVALLARKTGDVAADLQRLTLQLELADELFACNPDRAWQLAHFREYLTETEKYFTPLLDLLDPNQEPSANLSAQFAYQVAADLAASYYLKLGLCEDAQLLFDGIMRARVHRQIMKESYLWLRPPEKLSLYHMFMTGGGNNLPKPGDPDYDAMSRAAALIHWCPKFKQQFSQNFLKKYPEYAQSDKWRGDSVVQSVAVKDHVTNHLLNRNWRY